MVGKRDVDRINRSFGMGRDKIIRELDDLWIGADEPAEGNCSRSYCSTRASRAIFSEDAAETTATTGFARFHIPHFRGPCCFLRMSPFSQIS